jgi:hypothetical protein
MADFVEVSAGYARSDDVILMALLGLEVVGCFRNLDRQAHRLATKIRPKRDSAEIHRFLQRMRSRPSESIEDLLSRAEAIEEHAASLTKRNLTIGIYSPMVRVPKYAISRLFRAIGWRLRWDEVVAYLHNRCSPRRTKHTFVSFNYDLALEHSLELANIGWSPRNGYGAAFRWAATEDPDGYGADVTPLLSSRRANLVVLKPHGSVNWLAPTEGYHRLPAVATGTDGKVRHIDTTEVHVRLAWPNMLPVQVEPLIVPPVSRKNTDLPLLNHLRSREEAALQSADEVFVFGWSMPRTDVDQLALIRRAVGCRNRPFARVVAVSHGSPPSYFSRLARLFGVPARKVEAHNIGLRAFFASETAAG